MVNVIDEREDFAKYAHDKVGFYQMLGADKNIEVTVQPEKAARATETTRSLARAKATISK